MDDSGFSSATITVMKTVDNLVIVSPTCRKCGNPPRFCRLMLALLALRTQLVNFAVFNTWHVWSAANTRVVIFIFYPVKQGDKKESLYKLTLAKRYFFI